MAGRLAIDFGNSHTVIAYWRQASRQAETLYVPEVTRPIRMPPGDGGKTVYAAPSLILYGRESDSYLIGQEVAEKVSGLANNRTVFSNLRLDVITGKRVYNAAGSRWLCGQDMARDYLAAVISRASQVLGLGSEAVIAFTVPAEACTAEVVWQRYRRWLESTVRQAGFTRLELVEHPWAAAWGAGMPVKPEDRYIVIDLDTHIVETAIVQAGKEPGGDNERRLRVLSHVREWLIEPETGQERDNACASQLEYILRQTLRQAAGLGYTGDTFAGVIVTGSGGQQPLFKATIHKFFAGIPIYDKHLLDAAACGAATLTAGIDACGYIRHNYGVRYLDQDEYQYRLLAASGTFYPSVGPVVELTIKASYEGQQEYALFIYRLEAGGNHCINEEDPLIVTTGVPARCGQPAIQASISIDGAGQLSVTACEVGSGRIIADKAPAAKLI
ncbi:hypothetical protein [Sporomusa sp.]|uniref:hypothetical protein n=1 Tax=Sporomusa sp. TaxID=2078658 RepID=UPI002CB1E601|nr:hypothetical protein [Sporomusa sp.]HWR44701.1 hypothetical protein [Sporomusa sp.]